MPFEDFDVNAVGTLNLLEATRRHRPEAVFVLMSTNKVYGDAPNELPLKELETRWDYADEADWHGIDEIVPDRPDPALALRRIEDGGRRAGAGIRPLFRHEGRRLPRRLPDRPAALRASSCTGSSRTWSRPALSGIDLSRSSATRGSRSATTSTAATSAAPSTGSTRPRGPARSTTSAAAGPTAARSSRPRRLVEELGGRRLKTEYVDENRRGDHICYISDLRKLKAHYPGWDAEVSLREILRQIVASWERRGAGGPTP